MILLFPWIKLLWCKKWNLNFPWRLFIEMLLFLSFTELIFICYLFGLILKTCVLIFYLSFEIFVNEKSAWNYWNKTCKVLHEEYVQGQNEWQHGKLNSKGPRVSFALFNLKIKMKLGMSSWDNSEPSRSGNWNSFYFLTCFLHPLCMTGDLPFSLDLNTKNPEWYIE